MTDSSAAAPLRIGIIGSAASIVPLHLNAISKLQNATIVGMADVVAERGAARAEETGCPFFTDHRAMLAETQPNLAVICTPHPFHAPIAIDAFAAGANVLVEKPIAVEVAEADAMIAAAEKANRILAVSFQQRFQPAVMRAYEIIQSGELGEIIRVLCVEPWYRTAAYYRSAGWRASWRGEGGGVLMNQAPHTLDLLCHLAGMPSKVWGQTRTLRHAIECEDSAQAMLEYANGALGYIHINTTEAGMKRQLQIVGDRASLDITREALTIRRFSPSLREFSQSSAELFAQPDVQAETIELPDTSGGHEAVYRDLQHAIATGTQPMTNGTEGRMSLELANAIIFSSYAERAVTLPLDRAAYSAFLAERRNAEAIAS
ncbi:MAG TPA: Gfo/Idh/MocA family oxidoreductase [Roseiflexaceae bacterium]|jgi:predicted dehydrogenase|nr:Gfo/Idh/MocA family oxidoreductase [Roseiflexaceae bacterium]